MRSRLPSQQSAVTILPPPIVRALKLCGHSGRPAISTTRRNCCSFFSDFGLAMSEKRLNVERLLEIRESDECRQFREWLPTIEGASEAEIRDRTSSLRAKLGNAIQLRTGKAVRLLTTTGIGIAQPLVGILASIVDTFLVEKILPRSGVVAFLSDLYPSVFEDPAP